jgi:serine/threonine protein kinase
MFKKYNKYIKPVSILVVGTLGGLGGYDVYKKIHLDPIVETKLNQNRITNIFYDKTRGLSDKKVYVNEDANVTVLSGPKKLLQKEYGVYTKLQQIAELQDKIPRVYGVVDGHINSEGKLVTHYAHHNTGKNTNMLILIESIPGKLMTEYLQDLSIPIQEKLVTIKKTEGILDILHKNGLRHHDPGPHNVIIKNSETKTEPVLIDFADSCSCEHQKHFIEEKSRFNLRCISELLNVKVFDPLKSKEYQEHYSDLKPSDCHRY